MPVSFDSLRRASFDEIEFPVQRISIRGVIRDHIHEFPHADAGQPEKMGRKTYEIRMSCPFYSTFPKYPNLWPQSMAFVQHTFEAKTTADLVIPTFGVMKAYIHELERTSTAENLSGEDVEFIFYEDAPEGFRSNDIFVANADGLSVDMQSLSELAAEDRFNDAQLDQGLNTLQNGINSILALRDTADIYGSALESKILSVQDTCERIDAALSLNTPSGARIIDALQNVWLTIANMAADVMQRKSDLRFYATPSRMSIPEISAAIYGDNSYAVELLQLNDVADAFAVPANTNIRYYPAA